MLNIALITCLIPYHGIYFALHDTDAPIRPVIAENFIKKDFKRATRDSDTTAANSSLNTIMKVFPKFLGGDLRGRLVSVLFEKPYMTEIMIQEYKDEYKRDIVKMILKIQQEEYNLPITENDQSDLANIPAFYQQDDGNFWVCNYNDQVVGTIALKNIGDGNAVLRKMFVKQEYRGKDKGISKKLLSQLLDWASQKHFREIFLGTTPQFLAAHRFYEKNAFREIQKENLPTNFPVMEVDKKFYSYKL